MLKIRYDRRNQQDRKELLKEIYGEEQIEKENEEQELVIKTERKRAIERENKKEQVKEPEPENNLDLENIYKPEQMKYFMNNREYFTFFINELFEKYKILVENETSNISCDQSSNTESLSLMNHQKLVRDYINYYTPYRGLLLYHGLGSGKTCTSISIAEGIKGGVKKIIVMLPASLRRNFFNELKKCGSLLYKKNKRWNWMSLKTNKIEDLVLLTGFKEKFIKKKGGIFIYDETNGINYDDLSESKKEILESQIDELIQQSYFFINYNGLNKKSFNAIMQKYGSFDDTLIIIDEAHNFVSRIVNKIEKKSQDSISMLLYEKILSAKNMKLILLSGTPIINYPNEVAIMFNMIRGYVITFTIQLNVDALETQKRITEEYLQHIFRRKTNKVDYLHFDNSNKNLIITKNPEHFINKYKNRLYNGVQRNEEEDDNEDFVETIKQVLTENRIRYDIKKGIIQKKFKLLPDKLDDFLKFFSVQQEERRNFLTEFKNAELFKKRITGLTSYFRSAQEELLPRYEKQTDFHLLEIPMSDYQMIEYEKIRKIERVLEKRARLKKITNNPFDKVSSTYKIYSRLFCNYVLPEGLERPLPEKTNKKSSKKETEMKEENEENEEEGQMDKIDEIVENDINEIELEGADVLEELDTTYKQKLQNILNVLEQNSQEYLNPETLKTCSPKYLRVLENIQSETNKGKHLIYSQFRTFEGIGVLSLILKQNGFIKFPLIKTERGWDVDENILLNDPRDKFGLFTGTEEAEEKEIIRRIYNGEWDEIPENIKNKLLLKHENNNFGEIMKIFMITSSGAEGINLTNTRFVHIIEPYWNPVRAEQVIGRARRICSHKNLDVEYQTLEVFMYIMVFTKEQLDIHNEVAKELRINDKSKLNPSGLPITTDQTIYEIAFIKEGFNEKIKKYIKESSIDCSVYSSSNSKEGVVCMTPNPTNEAKESYLYNPDINKDQPDLIKQRNERVEEITGKFKIIKGVRYFVRNETNEVYDADSIETSNPKLIGKLKLIDNKMVFIRFKDRAV